MQTLKTAIVVVLLLTVTYSAYIALTAPAPEFSEDVRDIVIVDGMDDIDAGISPGFAESPPAAAVAGAGDPAGTPQSHYQVAPVGESGTQARLTDETLADAGSSALAAPRGAGELDPQLSVPPPRSLPKPDPSAGPAYGDPKISYESTAYPQLDLAPGDASLGAAASGDAQVREGEDSPRDDFALPAGTPSAETGDQGDSQPPTDKTATGEGMTAANLRLANAIATADQQWKDDRLREALTTLSLFYNDPTLTPADREPLQQRLDVLAGEVIYSPRHLLVQPYRVSAGDTLQSIAETYDVPWQLLANINGVEDPAAIVPGQELKIMRGPFRAEINIERSQLTLFLDELYAGRFPITPGSDPAPQPGTYTVQDKQTARTYYAPSGGDIPAGDPRNPYGDVWLDLGSQMCIHGSPENAPNDAAGCIRLRPADARDVYGILSQGSPVSIMR